MKKFKKILQYFKKIEEAHTLRKAKEVDEIQQFDVQKDNRHCRELDQMLKLDRAYKKRQRSQLEDPIAMEQESLQHKTQHISEVEDFKQQAMDTQLNTPGNELEVVAELQGFSFHENPHNLKQLPAGSADAFTHELTELTENQLQREFEENEAAIKEEPKPEEKKEPETMFFFHPPTPKKE
jgi:hypothetical protein